MRYHGLVPRTAACLHPWHHGIPPAMARWGWGAEPPRSRDHVVLDLGRERCWVAP